MTFPIDTITTAALDQTIDNPDIARTELYNLALTVKDIIAATGTGANDSLKLDANGKIPVSARSVITSYRPVLSTGTGNTFNVALGITTYEIGRVYEFLADKTTTGIASTTLNIDGLGIRSINDLSGGRMLPNQIVINQIVKVLYTGTAFEMQNAYPGSDSILYDISDTSSKVSKGQFLNFKTGSYQKIGDYVRFSGYIKVSTLGTLIPTSFLYILLTDIPFDFNNSPDQWGATVTKHKNIVGATTGGISMTGQNKFMRVYRHDTAGSSRQLTVGDLQATSELQFFGEFRVRF